MKFPLDSIESRLRKVIEAWMQPDKQREIHTRLVHEVVKTMQENAVNASDGRILAPCRFTLRLSPVVYRDLQGSAIMDNIIDALTATAEEEGIRFTEAPNMRLDADPAFSEDQIQVVVQPRQPEPGHTSVLLLETAELNRINHAPEFGGAFLIMSDNSVYPLRSPAVNIGRRPDNQVVINDPRVSRLHAQVRYSRGRFIVFDLNSTGGTEVNGQRIRNHALSPGDVISLAGVRVIYGEESMVKRDPDDDTKGMRAGHRGGNGR